MGRTAVRSSASEQEYLAFDRTAEERHEYADGETFAIPGLTWEHSPIAANRPASGRDLAATGGGGGRAVDVRVHRL